MSTVDKLIVSVLALVLVVCFATVKYVRQIYCGSDTPAVIVPCASFATVLNEGDSVRCHPVARLSVEHLYGATVVAKCECPAVPERAAVGPARVRDEGVSLPSPRTYDVGRMVVTDGNSDQDGGAR